MSEGDALALTLLIEVPAALYATRRHDVRFVAVAIASSCVTHPPLWALAMHLSSAWWWPGVLALEVVVAVVEGCMFATLARLGWPDGLRLGVVVNALSFGLGLAISPWT